MRFVYKIYSPYDGFTPDKIPERRVDGLLKLGGWKRYLDVVEKGWECWVYFKGEKTYQPGVYAVGFVKNIDYTNNSVYLLLRHFDPANPIKPPRINDLVSDLVKPKVRQVFVLPDDFEKPSSCNESACQEQKCASCSTFKQFVSISVQDWRLPIQLRKIVEKESVIAAYWIKPTICVYKPSKIVKNLTNRFFRFKSGRKSFAYPFALAIFEQLRLREKLTFDYIVPVPLSPDKVKVNEVHRTTLLAKKLRFLLGVPVKEMLQLTAPISKRRRLSEGATIAQFRREYEERLSISTLAQKKCKVLLVDDVLHTGSTLSIIVKRLKQEFPDIEVTIATIGQFIVKDVVLHSSRFVHSE
ncbi:MAG: hypothetical protein F4039_03015 [Gammaproteobacteria bacterium]|nr:hypothetical protein [Gammaproteobacteria bacterium]MYF52931.1 hypothetical protein [Gammaproteobacteria bacterium]MYK43045.1 hypothetical protein [Gammaproteobacteria bacterium]